MAQNGTHDFVTGAVDVRRATKSGQNTKSVATPTNYSSVSDMRARLTAINGTYYTAARLDQMAVNDMVFAIRLADDSAGVK